MTLLPAHRRLLMATCIILLGWGVAFYLLVWPLQKHNKDLAEQYRSLAADLKAQHIPTTQPAALKVMKDDAAKQKWELQKQMRLVYQRAQVDTELHKRILQEYSTIDAFRRSGSTLSYQTKFLALREELTKQNVYLGDGNQLGLSESTVSDNIYQLMMQLWLIAEVAELSQKNGLELWDRDWRPPVASAEAGDHPLPQHPVARLTVLPAKTYKATKDGQPFLEEYPIRFTVSGTWDQVNNFVLALTDAKEGRFLPLNQILVVVHKPLRNPWRSDRVDATLEVSSFLILTDNLDQVLPKDDSAPQHNVPPYHQGN